MSLLNKLIEFSSIYLPYIIPTIGVVVFIWAAHQILIHRHTDFGNERLFSRQLIMLGLTIISIILLVFLLPVSESARSQMIGLIGLAISGILAFSSSTIFANLMAGIMLRVTKPFQTGDFVTVGNYFGRVAERGLLDTEIQTEDRDLVALPNTYMITNPVSVVRSTGTIISVSLSLGYDLHHSEVEALLIQAVQSCGLEEPFVQVLELGNYSITYKASGMLMDVKTLLNARSALFRSILDTLHNQGIEIMSPAFMNQRRLPDEFKIIPAQTKQGLPEELSIAEHVLFDKAEQAEKIETDKEQLLSAIQKYEKDLENATEEDKKRIKVQIKTYRDQLKSQEQLAIKSSVSDINKA